MQVVWGLTTAGRQGWLLTTLNLWHCIMIIESFLLKNK